MLYLVFDDHELFFRILRRRSGILLLLQVLLLLLLLRLRMRLRLTPSGDQLRSWQGRRWCQDRLDVAGCGCGHRCTS